MTPNRDCKRCVLPSLNNGVCPVFHGDMSAEVGCPLFTTNLNPCDLCGMHIPNGGVIEADLDGNHLLCDECATKPLCHRCIQLHDCVFQTDKSCPEPAMKTITQNQGNMVIQTQIPNPKRVKLTCEASKCPCYTGKEIGQHCAKQLGFGCNKYKTNWRN